MDPRTFNKLIATHEDKGDVYITKTDKKGHYRLSGTSTVYARWEVFNRDQSISYEFLDYENSQLMAKYWNAVRNDLSVGYGSSLDSFQPKYIYNAYGDKIELELDYTTIERWHSRLASTTSQELFNENVYERLSLA